MSIMGCFGVEAESAYFWFFLAGLFTGCAAGSVVRRLVQEKRGRDGTTRVGFPVEAIFFLCGVCLAFLGMLLFTDVAAFELEDELLYTSLVGTGIGVAGLAVPRAGVFLLILTVLCISAAAIALQGTFCAEPGGTILQTRVLSTKKGVSTIEVSPTPLAEDPNDEGEVFRVSGRELHVQVRQYRRSAWFFLAGCEVLYGEMLLERVSATEGQAEMVKLSPMSSPIRKRLLQWAVRIGALHRRSVSAVQSDMQVLSTYFLTVEDDGIEWRMNVQ